MLTQYINSSRIEFPIIKISIVLKSIFRNSFIWTYNVYNTTGQREKYWDPFRALGKWQLLGIFLLPFTIHPSGRIIKVWFALRFFLLVSMAAIVPLILGLPPAGKDFTVILLLVEYTAYIEIYLLLHVAYYNEHGLLISHPLETAKHYLSHSFLIDVIGALPLPHILLWYNPDHTDRDQDPYLDMILPHAHYCMYRAIALLQNHRIVGGLVFLQGDTLSIYSLASYVLVMPLVLLMLFCASLRIVTECDFRFFLTQFPERKHSERIFENIGPYKNTTLYGYLFCGDKSWMKNTRFTNPDPAIVLMLAFFWIINIFSRVGTGAIPASDSFDMISSIVVAMFGICVFSYWLGFLSGESQRVYGLALSYQQKVQELLNFLEREMVEEDKITKMFKYFEYIWKRTSGMESKEMVEGLNSALREDITLGLYENILREVPIFKHVERSFLRVFAKHFHEEYFLRGDILIKCYDVQTTIYIVLRGRVEILTPYHDLIDTIGVGGMFGNIHGASLGCSSATFVAAGYVDLLGISSDTFFLVLRDYKTVQIILDELLLSASDYILPSAHTDFVSTTKARKLHANINEEEVEVEVKAHDYNQLAVELPHTVASLVKASSIHMGVHVPDNILLVMLLFFNPRKWFKFALEPSHTGIRYIWIMTYLACCIQCIFIPYMFVTQNFDIYIFTGTLLVEPIFYLRIFVFLHEAYMDEFGVYVKKFRLIAKHYFSDFYRVFWDIVPNLPIYLFFVLAKPGDRMFVFSYLRLYNLLRYKYILTFFKVLSTPLMAPRAPILLLKTITIFWTFVHGFALSSLMIFIPYGDLSRNTREYLKEANCFEAYVYCLYYVLSNVTTTGIGDITPLTKSELVLSITILIFTKISFSYLVVCCLMIIQMKAQHVLSYEFKVVRMKQFLENQDLSSHLMDKLWVYVRNLWSREAGLHLPELLEKAPYVLHCEIKTKIYSGHLRKGFLFKDINEALLNQICGRLQRVVFFPGNYIVQHGDTDSAMYVIHRGQVSVLTVHPNLTETRHEMLYVSEMFGITQGLNYGLAHRFSYRAETHCDILILSLPSWDFVLNQFPADKEIIYRRMHNAYATF